MEDILVYISGEDPVTKFVIERLLAYCSPRFKVFNLSFSISCTQKS